jgi:hypothetical protein
VEARLQPACWRDANSHQAVLGTAAAASSLGAGYLALVTGAVPVDLGLGRRIRPLGPFRVDFGAPREVVFDVLSEP